jgi:hypothetical protein
MRPIVKKSREELEGLYDGAVLTAAERRAAWRAGFIAAAGAAEFSGRHALAGDHVAQQVMSEELSPYTWRGELARVICKAGA